MTLNLIIKASYRYNVPLAHLNWYNPNRSDFVRKKG